MLKLIKSIATIYFYFNEATLTLTALFLDLNLERFVSSLLAGLPKTFRRFQKQTPKVANLLKQLQPKAQAPFP